MSNEDIAYDLMRFYIDFGFHFPYLMKRQYILGTMVSFYTALLNL